MFNPGTIGLTDIVCCHSCNRTINRADLHIVYSHSYGKGIFFCFKKECVTYLEKLLEHDDFNYSLRNKTDAHKLPIVTEVSGDEV